MSLVLAAFFSVAVAYIINEYMIKRVGEKSVVFITPVIEEALKTLPVYFLGGFILYVHIFFGIVESVYDLVHSSKKTGKYAAVISVVSHTFFGAVTIYVLSVTGSIIPALLAAVLIHGFWNYLVMNVL